MLGEFETYFASVDLDEFKAFLKDAKIENMRMKNDEAFDDAEDAEMVNFMMTLLDNIEDEIQGISSLSQLNFKKKVRLYSMIHLFHYICDDLEDEDDYFYEGDEDEDDEEDEEPEHEGDRGSDNSERIIRF